MAAVLQIREQPGRPIRAAIADAIGERALLIVLDNCEHVVDACAEVANSLLCACPALRILATSREPLGTAGEMTWIVGGLCTPSERTQPVQNVDDFESVQLFVERAKAVDPAFELTARNLRAAGQVCHRLDGIPLAIELVAARLPALTLDEILARLDRRLDLLTLGPRGAPPRQQTLRATVSWSYELLSEMDRRLLRQLSVFAGGWTQEAASAVCGLAVVGSDKDDCVSDGLARLVARSLVLHTQAPTGESRFSLLETIRAFAREQLALSEEEHTLCQRHAAYFLMVSEKWGEAAGHGPDRTVWLDRIAQEHANTTDARRWTVRENDDEETRLRWATAMAAFAYLRDHYAEEYAWNLALGAVPGVAPRTLAGARALLSTGLLACNGQIDFAAAVACYEAALPIVRAAEDTVRIVRALVNLGFSLSFQGDFDRGYAILEEAVATSRRSGERGREAMAMGTFGRVACARADWVRARELSKVSLDIAKQIGDVFTQSLCYRQLGDVARAAKDLSAAGAFYELSLARAAEVGHRQATTYSLAGMGHVRLASGASESAARFFNDSLALARQLGLRLEIAAGLEGTGCLAVCLGRHADGLQLIGAAAALRDATGAPRPPGVEQLLEPVLQTADRAVGQAACRSALQRGSRLLLDEAFGLAATVFSAADVPSRRMSVVLTRREQEVARLIGRGLTNKQIADELVLSPRTVAAHVEHILSKLRLRTRLQIALWDTKQAPD